MTEVEDLLSSHDLPATDAMVLRLGAGLRVMLRPSGTEPKLKVYFEAIEPVVAGDVAASRARGAAAIADVRTALAAATGLVDDQAAPNSRSPASPSPG